MASLSVIIPTHKRSELLKECLQHLEQQTIADDIEVIVVSDGHDDATSSLMQNTEFSMQNSFYEIEKAQQGVARNRGVQEAEAPIVLFSQDDIFLAPDACEKHLEAHNRMQNAKCRMQNSAVLGFTTWDPACDITPVMKWLEESGWQFGYPLIEHYKQQMIPKKSQHRFTYTSHISVPTRIALEFPFREDVTQYGWEDISWGEELRKDGIELYYEHEAKALHHHHISLEDSLKRMEGLGRSIKNFRESDRFPPMWKQMAYKILIALQPNSFASKHRKAFLKGLQS